MDKRVERANILEKEIEYIDNFISMTKKSQEVDMKNGKSNELRGINSFEFLSISSRISTGSKSPSYKFNLINDTIIKEFVNAGLPVLEKILEEKNRELDSLFIEAEK